MAISLQREFKEIVKSLVNQSVDLKVLLQRESESVLFFSSDNAGDTEGGFPMLKKKMKDLVRLQSLGLKECCMRSVLGWSTLIYLFVYVHVCLLSSNQICSVFPE